jgi:hypothetical protein
VPKLTPVNFEQTSKDAQFFTNWYAGPLSVSNNRGQNQFVPSNLQSFTTATPAPTSGAAPGSAVPATSAPATSAPATTAPATTASATSGSGSGSGAWSSRTRRCPTTSGTQFTVNGQFQPALELQPGQTEIWVLANISDFVHLSLTLTETATGNHEDPARGPGRQPVPRVHLPVGGDGTRLVMPPGRTRSRSPCPSRGDLVLEMPPMAGAQPVTSPGVLYTRQRARTRRRCSAVNVDPSVISYTDGFFTFHQQLIRARSRVGHRSHHGLHPTASPSAPTLRRHRDEPDVTHARHRRRVRQHPGQSERPEGLHLRVRRHDLPERAPSSPRLNSVEEWRIDNTNNDRHPMHIHVNDFQVMQIVDPVRSTTGVQMWGEDNVNVPAPVLDANGNVTGPASVTLHEVHRYTGTGSTATG